MTEINWPATVLAAFIGGAASLGVGYLTFINTDRGHDLKMVEISLSILRGESDAEKSTMARTFALRALEKYSGVELSEPEFSAWVNGGTVPFKATSLSNMSRTWLDELCLITDDPKADDCEVTISDELRRALDAIQFQQSLPPATTPNSE